MCNYIFTMAFMEDSKFNDLNGDKEDGTLRWPNCRNHDIILEVEFKYKSRENKYGDKLEVDGV